MIPALWWWLVAQAVALCALPLGLALFRPLADRGYGLTKAFGLLLFAYLTWLLAATPLLPNVLALLVLVLAAVGAGSALVLRRRGADGRRGIDDLRAFWHRRRGLLLLEEAIFLGAYAGFLLLRAYNPEVAGTEKFMDFAFLNAVTRSAHFPPLDPWLAPSPGVPAPTINYYYFGYLIQGLLLELANAVPGAVPPAVGFNLALGLLFALAAVGIFSLGYGLARDLVAERAVAVRRGPAPRASAPAAPAVPAAPAAPAAPAGRGPTWSLRAAWPYVATGLLAAYLLLIAGNLWTALRLVDGSGMWDRDFWQGIGWNATRVLVIKDGERDVDYTINEFPAFSFLLGDLHPHVLSLPFAILAVGLAYRWLLDPPRLYRWALGAGDPPPAMGSVRQAAGAVADVLPGALILGSLYFLNSWDFPAYFLLAQAGALAGAWWQRRRAAGAGPAPAAGTATAPGEAVAPWWRAPLAVALVGALALATVAPFLLTFRPPLVAEAGGLPLDLVAQRSRLSQFVQFWGAQLLLLAPAVLAAAVALGLPPVVGRTLGRSLRASGAPGIVSRAAPGWEPALLLGGIVVLVLLAERLQAGALTLALLLAGGAGWVAWQALAAGAAAGAAAGGGRGFPAGGLPAGGRPLAFGAAAIALAALLLAGCEVVYIRDFYGGALRRMNTVFKLYYQAWLLLAAGGSVCLFWLMRRLRAGRDQPGGLLAWRAALAAGGLLLLATSLFPLKAVQLRTDGFRNRPTLNGMAWMAQAHPEDYAAAEWLRRNGGPTSGLRAPVVLEATGDPYSEFARISTQTGFPTVLGWHQHERLWRGASIEEEVRTRQRDVDAIYAAPTLEAARPLLDKYRIAYVVVGYLERQKYGASGGLAKFDVPATPAVFRQGQTAVYRTAGAP